MKWSCSNQKAMRVPSSAPLVVVEYLSQTMVRLKMAYVGWYSALRANEDFNK
jgi:hypothetical protein